MLDKPPMSPQAQAQMGPPGGPNFGPGIAQAQQQSAGNPVEVAVSTVEKILSGIQDDTFQTYVQRAMAILKVGAAMAQQKGPQSGMGQPPKPGEPGPGPAPKIPVPPIPGQMPG